MAPNVGHDLTSKSVADDVCLRLKILFFKLQACTLTIEDSERIQESAREVAAAAICAAPYKNETKHEG